ncbi:phage baseplate plug family protein [Lactiplantibacillus mudanjiangensis]|uniref:Cyanophage baseplate Pam3 plug gp18 domain-containing protein n=1 Tax=Lactiplantibacillus mudanjiangensis TaxID=1296538 RepID=A0A660E064_9LACO|nr:hypothetical protein [Lactiplantibacillus mudanjiangensis]VDG23661.1 hypothetical protein MUDAN_IGPPGNFN_02198 [Lactiplantibacillus mudanjiangensis]VDG27804.1 hypothetical protein MUDAN_MDHGFNIF_02627 [Lactiplantibacillus mudanjiangensis]
MAIRNYIDFDLDELPDIFDFDFEDGTLQLTLDYNEEGDFYTLSMADDDENVVLKPQKLCLGVPIGIHKDGTDLPHDILVPMDESGLATSCDASNFGQTVFLYIDDLADGDDGLSDELDTDTDISDTDTSDEAMG